MDNKVDTFSFKVDPFDTDCFNQLSWKVLGKQILSVATSHARNRGFDKYDKDGIPYLWVLSRMVVEIDRYPRVGEEYSFSTWIKNYYRYFTDRYFYIYDADGNVIGRVLTIWAMINSETRQPADLKSLFGNEFDQYVCDANEFEIQRSRIRVNHPCSNMVRHTYYTDLDTNGHINSIRYIEYVLDAFPLSVFQQNYVSRIEMEYNAESYCDDDLYVNLEEVQPRQYNAEISRMTDGKMKCVCRSNIQFSQS